MANMTAASHQGRPPNPYAKCPPAAAINKVNMGRQSQQRIGNQNKRKFKLASNSNKRRKGQQTLLGNIAFDSERDCQVCKARALARLVPGARIPKRGHHKLCSLNTKTRGKGELTAQQLLTLEDNKRYKALTQPITEAEKGRAKHLPADGGAAFFGPRKMSEAVIDRMKPVTATTGSDESVESINFCQAVSKMVTDSTFAERHKAKHAPLSIMAFANEVAEKIIRPKQTFHHFDGIVMTVPPCHDKEEFDNPHYHSIIGQKLLYVDWQRSHGVQIPCPDGTCKGSLQNDRTNYSKNKTLFPIFTLEGPPMWCIIMSMVCDCCRRRYDSNEGDVLVNLPEHVAAEYPVEPQFAFANFGCHLSRSTTDVFSSIMLTYGNGELCSKLLYNTLNRSYIQRIKAYYSKAKMLEKKPKDYVMKDGAYIKTFPPLGDTIRDMFDASFSSCSNAWRVSDFDRHTREIQSVSCDGVFCQDHTFEPIKNYRKIGSKAAWTVGTGTGEIAAVVLVPTTKTEDFSHAAKQLLDRTNFNPKAMYSDTWPNKNTFWNLICPGIEGRLGLFHFEKRIISTLRKKHIDCYEAVSDLLSSIYTYHAPDFEKLLDALKEGKLSVTGHKYTSDEIADLRASRLFRDRYSKYLRKELHSPQTIIQNLDDWFCKYKVTSSEPDKRPARGRLDPVRQFSLFTADTKDAVKNCKAKAKFLKDPLPLQQMYDEIPPHPNSKHQLTEFLSKRGESKLESFHDRFAHFANCGMREALADNLNLAGTARFNIAIRHKRSLLTPKNPAENPSQKPSEDRKTIPAAWEKVVPYYNHTELAYVNKMAKSVDCNMPFPTAETLPPDNGERFFSQYMNTLKQIGRARGDDGECLCNSCKAEPITNRMNQQQQNQNEIINQQTDMPVPKRDNAASQKASRPAQIISPTPVVAAQHPIANSFTHRKVGAPALTQQQVTHAPIIMPYPYFVQPFNFFCMAPAPMPCCPKYEEWLTRRVGRPPHHPLCQNR